MSEFNSVQRFTWKLDEKGLSLVTICSETFILKDDSLGFNLKLIGSIVDSSKIKSKSNLRICVRKKNEKVFGVFKLQFLSVETNYPFNNLPLGEYDVSTYYHHQEFPTTNVGRLLITWQADKNIATEYVHSKICEIFRRLLECDEFSDEVIGTEDGSKFSVHRSVLAARSPVFRALLKTDKTEAKTSSIEIRDFSSKTVKNMIKYMYAVDLPEMNYELTVELLGAADKYDITDMKRDCLEKLLEQLDTSNALDLLQIMDKYNADVEKKHVLQYISAHKLQFKKPDAFDCLKGNPKLLTELLNSIINN